MDRILSAMAGHGWKSVTRSLAAGWLQVVVSYIKPTIKTQNRHKNLSRTVSVIVIHLMSWHLVSSSPQVPCSILHHSIHHYMHHYMQPSDYYPGLCVPSHWSIWIFCIFFFLIDQSTVKNSIETGSWDYQRRKIGEEADRICIDFWSLSRKTTK